MLIINYKEILYSYRTSEKAANSRPAWDTTVRPYLRKYSLCWKAKDVPQWVRLLAAQTGIWVQIPEPRLKTKQNKKQSDMVECFPVTPEV